MAHRKTGQKHQSDSGERRVWDGLTKILNPHCIGVDPGLDLDSTKPGAVPGKDTAVPKDPRRKYRKVPGKPSRSPRLAG